ncbi:MAG TPA: LysR family transcriptional regulator substrate-binding protein, partial [Chthoniobacterales bacterium]
EILAKTENAARRIQDETAGRSGEMTLACTDGARSEHITRQLRKFRRKSRGLRLIVRRVDYGSVTVPESADAFITDFPVNELPTTAVVLERAALQVAVPPKHRLAEREDFAPADLIGETIITSPFDLRSPAERILLARLEAAGIAHDLELGSAHLQERFWQVSLGLGVCFCTSADRGTLDSRRISLAGAAQEAVIALIPNPNSRAAALPALVDAIRA